MRAVLWDADGVLQHLPDGWEASMRPVVEGHIDDLPGFLAEAFELERPALLGEVSRLDVLLDGAFWSHELGLAKPDPAFFTTILDRLGLEADEVLFVDDSLRNVEAARSVGPAAERWHIDAGLPVLRDRLHAHSLPV